MQVPHFHGIALFLAVAALALAPVAFACACGACGEVFLVSSGSDLVSAAVKAPGTAAQATEPQAASASPSTRDGMATHALLGLRSAATLSPLRI